MRVLSNGRFPQSVTRVAILLPCSNQFQLTAKRSHQSRSFADPAATSTGSVESSRYSLLRLALLQSDSMPWLSPQGLNMQPQCFVLTYTFSHCLSIVTPSVCWVDARSRMKKIAKRNAHPNEGICLRRMSIGTRGA